VSVLCTAILIIALFSALSGVCRVGTAASVFEAALSVVLCIVIDHVRV